MLETTNIDNWLEVVFKSKKENVHEILKKIFTKLININQNAIPNFTVRRENTDFIVINVKILRNKVENTKYIDLIKNEIGHLTHSFDYKDNHYCDSFYTWKNNPKKNMSFWTENNAKFLHEISKFILFTDKPDNNQIITLHERSTWEHYLDNMTGIYFP